MTPQAAVIPRRKRDAAERPFDQLRGEGLQWLQAMSGERWTDHNLHDPGITLLEQLCFALTELAYRADFPVADHLTGPDGRIDHAALSLHPPAEVFPCRATTAADYRRVLLDQVTGVDDAALLPGQGPWAGVHHLTLKLSPGSDEATRSRIAQARAAYRHERNLCEDLDDAVTRIRGVPIDLLGEIDLTGARDAIDVMAEVYHRCARFIARLPRIVGLEEARRSGQTLEEIYTGPRVTRGFLAEDDGSSPFPDTLFLDDLSTRVREIEGIAQVRLEALVNPADPRARDRALPWRGADWALRLRTPEPVPGDFSGGTPAFSRLSVRRRGQAVHLDLQALYRRFADRQAGDLAHHGAAPDDEVSHRHAGLPRGVHRGATVYRSVQHDFPAAYGLGRHGFSSSAPVSERARVRQFKAYLRLFDQVIANGRAQVDHLAELFSLNGHSPQTYWYQAVDTDEPAGRDGVLLGPVDAVLRSTYASFDRSAERRSRALDHLLALHGVTYRQDSLRQFAAHLDADEVDSWLLRNKAAFLRDIVVLGRDRASGVDYSRPAWSEPSNCAGLQRRACLLLGFRLWHGRPLTSLFTRQKIKLDVGGATALSNDQPPPASQRVNRVTAPADAAQLREDLLQIVALRSGSVSATLLRAGVRRDLYAMVSAQPNEASAHQRLMLGPDEDGQWWTLGDFASAAQAARAADSLRRYLRHLSDDSEGMHIVEHLLLRPLANDCSADTARGPSEDFFALRLSVVLPAWTARTHDPAFRRFAEETLRINCPAHLALQCLWLEFEAMQRFEDDFGAWMQAKAAHCQAVDRDDAAVPTLAASLDEASRRVIRHLTPGPGHE